MLAPALIETNGFLMTSLPVGGVHCMPQINMRKSLLMDEIFKRAYVNWEILMGTRHLIPLNSFENPIL